ncbi:WD40/YVTN/BNR-like repeat-containing protein [Robiginitalea sp. IMCC44478]|uniref:WD40/YVTN/BNR-like repeat-containing protein n=1 Tax=Robiginitalea sp. IMCC44478 TaxID=3459122 RepID=UPI004042744B
MRKILHLWMLLASLTLSSQEFNMKLAGDLKPRNIGPGGMSGRVTAIDVVNSNPDIMYVGTASGGLWKSNSGGIKWEPIFDKQVTASIGAVAIQQSNPSVIWVGTGEGNPRNSLNGGFGVFRSLDGGKHWQRMGLENTRHIHRIIIDPDNPNTVYVGAIGSPWGEHPERGLYKTTDGGETWQKILFVNNRTGVADMVMDPSNPNKILVAMWEHKRDPWFFKSGGAGSGLYMTHDGGKNWKQLTEKEGLPAGDLGRIGIAISTNKPDVIYALVEAKKNALYKSEDGGFHWKKINDKNDIGNRPFYYSDIFVDPENENRVYSVFTYVNVSEDGGKSFKELMPAYGVDNGVHPDHHAWWIHPQNGQFMIDGNDGGMNITKDGGKTWRFIGNLPVGQFYHISVDEEFPYNVYGGMQDNGSWRGPAYVWRAQGIRNSYWQEIAFGDGFDVVPDRDNSQYGYAMSQQGNVRRYDWKTGNDYSVRPTPPDDTTELRFNWNAGIGQDPFDNSTVYFGSQFVHKSTDKGLTWTVISPDLTTNDPEKQKQKDSGGLTMDATGAENHCTILVIEPSPLEKDMLWVGTDDGRVHITKNGGASWTEVTQNIKGLPKGSWIPQIRASTRSKGEALLIANDYRRYNYTPYAYRTRDYGKSWERIVDGKDVASYTLSIIEDPQNPKLLFLGTDDGLYISMDGANSWKKWTNGYPTVSTKDLAIHPREQDLVIGTFGRAAWVLDDIRPLRAIAGNPAVLSKEISLFPSPTAYLAAYQQPSGMRFGGDATFNAENRKPGAMITYYLREGKQEASGKKQEDSEQQSQEEEQDSTDTKKTTRDSVFLKIYDGERLIRTLKYKTPDSAGLHRVYWGLDEAGPDRPSRTIRKRNREPGGTNVKPGSYRAVIHLGEQTDETTIEVAPDPRLEGNPAAIEAAYNASKKLEGFTQTAADAVKQLVESKNIAQKFQKDLKEKDKEQYKEQIKASGEIVKQIDSLIADYLGVEDKRQGITRNPEMTVLTRIRNASRYAASRPAGLTATENNLMAYAEKDLKTALSKTNAFFAGTWKEYREKMQALDLSPFKETETFNVN